MLELFGYYLQRGLIDVGFLGAAQIDRFGNINTTVIGDYAHPTTRLPGFGWRVRDRHQRPAGLRDHAPVASARSWSASTSGPRPGNLGGAEDAARIRAEQGWMGSGPSVVVTDLGIYHFDEDGEMRLDSLHPGATSRQSAPRSAGQVAHRADLPTTPPPTADELRLIREELDPAGDYTK